jgi:hypothetical protein
MARQLVIVSRDDPGLFHALRADWAGHENVAVIMDRRFGQRRRSGATSLERRCADRRQHPPAEAYLAWRGGGAPARRADVLSVLGGGSSSIAVRQRPHSKAAGRPPSRSHSDQPHESAAHHTTTNAQTHVIVASVILLGALSGGLFSGLALWLFLTKEFSLVGARASSVGGPATSSSELITRWQQPLKKLLRAYRG